MPQSEEGLRWQGLFQRSAEPLFFLNRRRRVVFVNRAWETLTGLTLAEVKGQACRRRPRGILSEKIELILGAMAPPPEAVQGQSAQARRLAASMSWRVEFFPLSDADGLAGLLGKIHATPAPPPSATPPLSETLLNLRDKQHAQFRIDRLVGSDPAMERLAEQIRLAAHTSVPATLVGPPGAGKHWVARAIHVAGPMRDLNFARLDAARLPADVLARTLFDQSGRMRLGTVYLQNPGALAREEQMRLAHWLESRGEQPGPRVLLGLTADPDDEVRAGRLAPELACQASPFILRVPALKDRAGDLDAWIEAMLSRVALTAAHPTQHQPDASARPGLSPEALTLLKLHSWPGNLRELYQVLVDACRRAKTGRIEASDLPFYLRQAPAPPQKPLPLDELLTKVERRLIVLALTLCNQNKAKAAELLAVWRPRLLRRMEALNIQES